MGKVSGPNRRKPTRVSVTHWRLSNRVWKSLGQAVRTSPGSERPSRGRDRLKIALAEHREAAVGADTRVCVTTQLSGHVKPRTSWNQSCLGKSAEKSTYIQKPQRCYPRPRVRTWLWKKRKILQFQHHVESHPYDHHITSKQRLVSPPTDWSCTGFVCLCSLGTN